MVLEGEKSGTKELSLVRTHDKKADGSTAGGNGVGGLGDGGDTHDMTHSLVTDALSK